MSLHQAAGLLVPPPPPVRSAPWIAVTGGKGGVGKTLLAVHLAVLAARSGRRVLLADLDPGLANVDVHLRLSARWSLEDLARGACSPAQALVAGPAGVKVLTGRSGSTALTHDAGLMQRALAAVARAGRGFDLVVCDTGAGIGPMVLATLRASDLPLAVTTPDPAAITDAYALTKLLAQEGGAVPALVVNRVRDREQALRTATRLRTVAARFLGVEPPLAGWLHDDAALAAAVGMQQPLALAGRALQDLQAILGSALSALPARGPSD